MEYFYFWKYSSSGCWQTTGPFLIQQALDEALPDEIDALMAKEKQAKDDLEQALDYQHGFWKRKGSDDVV